MRLRNLRFELLSFILAMVVAACSIAALAGYSPDRDAIGFGLGHVATGLLFLAFVLFSVSLRIGTAQQSSRETLISELAAAKARLAAKNTSPDDPHDPIELELE